MPGNTCVCPISPCTSTLEPWETHPNVDAAPWVVSTSLRKKHQQATGSGCLGKDEPGICLALTCYSDSTSPLFVPFGPCTPSERAPSVDRNGGKRPVRRKEVIHCSQVSILPPCIKKGKKKITPGMQFSFLRSAGQPWASML